MENDGELARDRDLGLFLPNAPCQLGAPGFERRSPANDIEQHVGGLEEIVAHQSIAMLGDPSGAIDLPGLVSAWRESEIGADIISGGKPLGIINGANERQGRDRAPLPALS